MLFTLKSSEEIELIKTAGKGLVSILNHLEDGLKQGEFNTPLDLNDEFLNKVSELGSEYQTPFVNVSTKEKGRYGYPICVSRNQEIVHSRPTDVPFFAGDIVKIDAGLSYKGWSADIARTVRLGGFKPLLVAGEDPLYHTQMVLDAAIRKCRPWGQIGDISTALASEASSRKMFVITDFTGHGIGKEVHEEPLIPQIPLPGYMDVIIRPGMVLCIEVILADIETKCLADSDGWRVFTSNGACAYHREAMVVINDHSAEVIAQ